MNWSFPKWELRVGRSEFLAHDDYIPWIYTVNKWASILCTLTWLFLSSWGLFTKLQVSIFMIWTHSCIFYSLCLFSFMPSSFSFFLSLLLLRMEEFSLQQGTCSRVRRKPPGGSGPRVEEPGALLSWGLWSKGISRCVFILCKRVWAYNFGMNSKKKMELLFSKYTG